MTTRLTHPVTGHELSTDGESVGFWKSAGYVEKVQVNKAPAKKAASRSPKK